MFCCAAIPFCYAGAILMVFLTSTLAPLISESCGEYALILIPLSAVLGIVLGWFAMVLLFSLI